MIDQGVRHASSTGQGFTDGAWLDVHFEAARPEYEVQLRAVGIQPGWRVLDAACGSGSFLPALAELVGPQGHLAALDLAPENVTMVEQRQPLPCPVEARAGSVLDIPYADDSFDAVWFANTSQYLTHSELTTALQEFLRVVRPGGLVAVKEVDCTLTRVFPAPPGLMFRWFDALARTGMVQSAGGLRGPALADWLRRAGLVGIWQRCTLIERTTPLDAFPRQFWRDLLTGMSGRAPSLDLPLEDEEVWAALRDPATRERFLDAPDFYVCEGNILVVGTVPETGRVR